MLTSHPRRAAGFTLVEMAIVLLVVMLLAGAGLFAVRAQFEIRRMAETREAIALARAALLGHLAAHGRFPCPEDPAGNAVCQQPGTQRGVLPFRALGLAAVDGWGRRLNYAVADGWGSPGVLPGLASLGSIEIQSRDNGGNPFTLAPGDTIAVVIWSAGPNGFFGVAPDPAAAPIAGAAAGADEQINGAGPLPVRFFTRPPTTAPAAAGGAFDDIVESVSRYEAVTRLIEAGQLP